MVALLALAESTLSSDSKANIGTCLDVSTAAPFSNCHALSGLFCGRAQFSASFPVPGDQHDRLYLLGLPDYPFVLYNRSAFGLDIRTVQTGVMTRQPEGASLYPLPIDNLRGA